jgi:hypothetical protein
LLISRSPPPKSIPPPPPTHTAPRVVAKATTKAAAAYIAAATHHTIHTPRLPPAPLLPPVQPTTPSAQHAKVAEIAEAASSSSQPSGMNDADKRRNENDITAENGWVDCDREKKKTKNRDSPASISTTEIMMPDAIAKSLGKSHQPLATHNMHGALSQLDADEIAVPEENGEHLDDILNYPTAMLAGPADYTEKELADV